MPDDPSGRNEEELLSQIDDLRSRMDRLMKGGTSTSNSALLTDAPTEGIRPVTSEPVPEPPPERTRVRDLIGSVDREVVEAYSGNQEAVVFPENHDNTQDDDKTQDVVARRPQEDRPAGKPRSASVDGSLISVSATGRNEPRRRVTSFDDIGSAVEEELARDVSVPPAESKKGPDLASRFGPAEDPVPTVVAPERDLEPVQTEDPDVEVAELDPDEVPVEVAPRSRRGALVAIWAFTGITAGIIAVLHVAGLL
jgi:hypothetical protein